MSSIIIATLAVAVIGLLIGILLVTVDKKFKVEVDEKQVAIRECLPGNNCGGCGYAGCDALASAIANQEAPVNACPVGGDPVAWSSDGKNGKSSCLRQMFRRLRECSSQMSLRRHPRLRFCGQQRSFSVDL